jgi:hypothetical protein
MVNEYSGYIPRKCSYTKQLISASDRSSVQISFKKRILKNEKNEKILFVVCGNLRKQGRSDEILNGLVEENDFCN